MSDTPTDPTAGNHPDTAQDEATPRRRRNPFARINLAPVQKFGRSLMLPIAVLPAAALLLRLGQPDLLGEDGLGWDEVAPVIGAAGSALFDHLPLLFAIGIAIGMAKKADGSTALAALVGYLVYESVTEVMSPMVLGAAPEGEEQELINYGVLGGIIMGLLSAWLWQRYHRIKLPPYLAFFGGRRFVPLLTALAGIVVGVVAAFPYPAFDSGLTSLSETLAANTVIGGFVYGMMNRLLIPLGLHHILNNFPWFMYGSYEGDDGSVAHGEIARFFAGDPTAGAFMTGFFPILMFGLPAAAFAIWRCAKPKNRKLVGGIMLSAALTAFLTGVTEPLEFAFMFVAWPLYIIHAVLTGTSMALVNFLELKLGFGFSAGLFDMLLNWGIATGPIWIVLIGLMYAVIYYVVFTLAIRLWNLKTPGREEEEDAQAQPETT
ncbi:PTS transporter subunit EIIC [Nesterenkonia marinintestina]|uniref:PTS transporter subunit EIIC n=1 Tax=Nesterenkonia marinintestina TaxID=2979865 RepID=UPI0021BE5263|nr:PTS transporter subunit EIIC [Nesterenkonia sp. GX14115]